MRLSKKLAIAAVSTVSVAGLATGAFALWSAGGSGSGSAKAYSAQAISVTASASPTADTNLYPAGPAVNVTGSAHNPNPYTVSFTGWANAAVASASGCDKSNFQIAAASGSFSSPLSIAAGGDSAVTAPTVVKMIHDAPDACQGATVVVSFDLAGGGQS